MMGHARYTDASGAADELELVWEEAQVRAEKTEALEGVLRQMFARRNHRYVSGQEKHWLTVELIQSLRRKSDVYREALSSKMAGPLPFALAWMQVRDGTLRMVSDRVPGDVPPETLVRLLSEFLQPGARLRARRLGGEEAVWEIQDIGEVERLQGLED